MLRLCVIVVKPATGLLFRLDWRHLERIPASGPAILVFNHVSHADPFVVARAVWDSGRIPRFLAKESLFELPIAGAIMRGAGQIPVRRSSRDASHSLQGAVQALRRGEVVIIYPEGTVTRDERFWPMVAKTGIARLIELAPDVPVVPIGQWGPQQAVDLYRRRLRLVPRTRVVVSVGEPVDTSAQRGEPSTAQFLRRLTDVVMTAVRDQVAEIRGEQAPVEFGARPLEPATDRDRPA